MVEERAEKRGKMLDMIMRRLHVTLVMAHSVYLYIPQLLQFHARKTNSGAACSFDLDVWFV